MTPGSFDEAAPDVSKAGQPQRNRPPAAAIVVAGLIVVSVLVAYSLMAWTWSLIDDAEMRLNLLQSIDEHGLLQGIAARIRNEAAQDWRWEGLFRPMFSVYDGLFYLLPVGVAHAARLLMLGLVIGLPAWAVRRAGAPWWAWVWAAVLMAANWSLALGLTYLSLQELSAAVLVAIGFTVARPWLRVALFIGACWFKAPFVWLPLIYSALTIRKHRAVSIVGIVISLGTLVAGFIYSRRGIYTQKLQVPTAESISAFVGGLAVSVSVMLLVIVIGAVLFKFVGKFRPGPLTISLAAATCAYIGILALWPQTAAYYHGGPLFLLGLTFVSLLIDAWQQQAIGLRFRSQAPVRVVLVFAAAIALLGLRQMVVYARQIDDTERAVIAWSQTLPPGTVVGVSWEEPAPRLNQLRTLQGLPTGDNGVTFESVADSAAPPPTEYYLAIPTAFYQPRWAGTPVLVAPYATALKVN